MDVHHMIHKAVTFKQFCCLPKKSNKMGISCLAFRFFNKITMIHS
jgi:hypothetical protein